VIFCGLGINNTIMYDQVKKSWAKQSVALDVRTLTRKPSHSVDQSSFHTAPSSFVKPRCLELAVLALGDP